MSANPLVSCIVIFLDAEAFITEAIESILAQTYDRWELFLVDDGSTDNSTNIARRYADTHPEKIRYLMHPGYQNKGMSATRNLGICHALGDYVAFLDADDRWLSTKLAEQVAILTAHPEAAMVYGRSRYWYSWTKHNGSLDHLSQLGTQPNTLVQPPHLLVQFLQSAGGPSLGSTLIRRSVFATIGQFEEDFRDMCEDQVFFAKVFLDAPVYAASQCWHDYRQHSTSCSAAMLDKPAQNFAIWEQYLTWLEAYLIEKGDQETKVWQIVQEELLVYRYPERYYLSEPLRYLRWWLKRIVKRSFLTLFCQIGFKP